MLEDKREDFGVASWYELLASLLYIYKNSRNWNIDQKPDSLFKALIEQKPQYNEEQCNYALDVLAKRGFVQMGV